MNPLHIAIQKEATVGLNCFVTLDKVAVTLKSVGTILVCDRKNTKHTLNASQFFGKFNFRHALLNSSQKLCHLRILYISVAEVNVHFTGNKQTHNCHHPFERSTAYYNGNNRFSRGLLSILELLTANFIPRKKKDGYKW